MDQTIFVIDIPDGLTETEPFTSFANQFIRQLGDGTRENGRFQYWFDQSGQAKLTKDIIELLLENGCYFYGWPPFWVSVESDATVPSSWEGSTDSEGNPILLKDYCIHLEIDGQLWIRFKDVTMSNKPPLMTHADFLRYREQFPEYVIGPVSPV